MKYYFGVLLVLVSNHLVYGKDTIPVSLKPFLIKEHLTIAEEQENKVYSLNKFCDYIVTNSFVADSILSASYCYIDSMLLHLNSDAQYYFMFHHINRKKDLLASLSTVFKIENKKVLFGHVMENDEEGSGRKITLLPNQFVDVVDSSRYNVFKRDIFLYNIVDDTCMMHSTSIKQNSKRMLLNFLEHIKSFEYNAVHVAYVTRFGMSVIKDYCFQMSVLYDYYHRLIEEVQPAPLY